jgi:hypothetical protein
VLQRVERKMEGNLPKELLISKTHERGRKEKPRETKRVSEKMEFV